jgi:hypothetical protein
VAAACLLLAPLLSGCSDSDGDGDRRVTTPTPTASQTPTVDPTPTVTPTPTVPPTPTQPPATGFPDASNTGVPSGTVLTPYPGCVIAETVTLDARQFNCDADDLLIRARNVVITNSKILGGIEIDTDQNRTWSLTLTDSTVQSGPGDLTIANGNVTLIRDNISGGHNGLECQEHSSFCVMRDSYVHDQYAPATGPTHLGGFLALGSVVPCTGIDAGGVKACVEFTHNTIVCDAPVNTDGGGCTGDINLIPHFGPLHGAVIQNNLLGANTGSAYCTYGGARVENPADHIIYRDNVFQRGTNGRCADYGPVTSFDSNAVGNVWSNNLYDDGTVVAPAN